MGRLKIDLALALFAIIFVNCVVQSEYYIEQPTHIYVVGGPDSDDAVSVEEDEVVAVSPQNAQFQSRRGVASSDEVILLSKYIFWFTNKRRICFWFSLHICNWRIN